MSIADYGFAIWETFYVTALSTAFALVLGLPLGVLLVAGDKDGVLPLPSWLMHILNIVINILRSVPFLILMICVFPLTRAIVGTTVGTKATIVPLVVAAFPFVARLVETSLRELDEGVVEAAQSMGATPFQIITKVIYDIISYFCEQAVFSTLPALHKEFINTKTDSSCKGTACHLFLMHILYHLPEERTVRLSPQPHSHCSSEVQNHARNPHGLCTHYEGVPLLHIHEMRSGSSCPEVLGYG